MPTKFEKKAWALLKKIPRGRVSTYKQIAIGLCSPEAARAVGNACNKNPFAPQVPCHRVVKTDGSLGGYAKGGVMKRSLLLSEGIKIKNNRILNFSEAKIIASDLK